MAHRAASAAYAALFSELIAGPSTVAEMVEASGMHENTVRKFVRAMYNRKSMYTFAKCEARDGRKKVKLHAIRGWK